MDKKLNWRLVEYIASNLSYFCKVFPLKDIDESILPIFFKLSHEKVAEVRHSAAIQFSAFIDRFKLTDEARIEQLCQ
jgi:hypothetical protein